jgi:carboxypeptidase family protein
MSGRPLGIGGIALVLAAAFLVARPAFAQEATLSGTISDQTASVLPGATVTAVHQASGNMFVAVTDDRGFYRLPLRTGVYRITVELQGFATANRSVELLVGQQAVINLQMAPSTVQETVTVTAEAPLLDMTSSTLAGNVDPRQMQDLPVNGRNWLDLTMLTPGARTNSVGEAPVLGDGRGTYQLNVDGQQVTNYVQFNRANPRYSRDAIAEFEFVANRFDATQGRSMGVQINAITKSGTNTPAGTFSGYFRDDSFNASDFIANKVLPYSNQQLSGTFGGPIKKDRVHYFANYEYEREPRTSTWNTPYKAFNIDLTGTRWQREAGIRVDVQFSPRSRLSMRGTNWHEFIPYAAGSATSTPSSTVETNNQSNQFNATWTRVFGTSAVNEVKFGYAGSGWNQTSPVKNPKATITDGYGSPNILLRGLTIGTGTFAPQRPRQRGTSIRDDYSTSFTAAGRHAVKVGGEYIYDHMQYFFCNVCNGQLDARNGPIPANVEQLFPDLFDAGTWNMNALSALSVRWRQGIGDFNLITPRHVIGTWLQDDWAIKPRFTLNLGVRYDLQTNAFENEVGIGPFLPANRPNDTNNVAPRVGFALTLTPRTVIRGGVGKFYGDVLNPHFTRAFAQQISPERAYDGRPDFAANPFNGPVPSYNAVLASLCSVNNVPGCLRRELPFTIFGPWAEIPYSYQASVGVQRQIGASMGVNADYIYTGERKVSWNESGYNINLSYNPATGVNYPFSDISHRPYPEYGAVDMWIPTDARSNYHALSTAFTKRMSGGWQASGTYLLSGVWDAYAIPYSGLNRVTFPVAPDLGGEYSLAQNDQRHRVVLNGIWQLKYGFQASGLYFYGSGSRYPTSYGTDLRDLGGIGANRLRPNGTIVPRNNFVGLPLHRVDVRLQRKFTVSQRTTIEGIAEVFNLFNHTNYGAYTTQEVSVLYGKPSSNPAVAYQPRMAQLGFRVTF